MTLYDFTLSTRLTNSLGLAYHCFEKKRYNLLKLSLEDLMRAWPPTRLRGLKNFGKGSFNELTDVLFESGVSGVKEWSGRCRCHICGNIISNVQRPQPS